MGSIYRAICAVTGKIYIGQTVKPSWRDRYPSLPAFIEHKVRFDKPLSLFERAVRKHGMHNFEFRDLLTNVADSDLDPLEIFFIRYFKSDDPRFGYNLETGGGNGKRHSDRTIALMRAAHRARSKVVRWTHPSCGEHRCCVVELIRRFPQEMLVNVELSSVRDGKRTSYKGWRCLDAPPVVKSPRRHRTMVWMHPERGQVVASRQTLAETFFPHMRKARWNLGQAMKSPERSAYGWRAIREATPEEEAEGYLALAC